MSICHNVNWLENRTFGPCSPSGPTCLWRGRPLDPCSLSEDQDEIQARGLDFLGPSGCQTVVGLEINDYKNVYIGYKLTCYQLIGLEGSEIHRHTAPPVGAL